MAEPAWRCHPSSLDGSAWPEQILTARAARRKRLAPARALTPLSVRQNRKHLLRPTDAIEAEPLASGTPRQCTQPLGSATPSLPSSVTLPSSVRAGPRGSSCQGGLRRRTIGPRSPTCRRGVESPTPCRAATGLGMDFNDPAIPACASASIIFAMDSTRSLVSVETGHSTRGPFMRAFRQKRVRAISVERLDDRAPSRASRLRNKRRCSACSLRGGGSSPACDMHRPEPPAAVLLS